MPAEQDSIVQPGHTYGPTNVSGNAVTILGNVVVHCGAWRHRKSSGCGCGHGEDNDNEVEQPDAVLQRSWLHNSAPSNSATQLPFPSAGTSKISANRDVSPEDAPMAEAGNIHCTKSITRGPRRTLHTSMNIFHFASSHWSGFSFPSTTSEFFQPRSCKISNTLHTAVLTFTGFPCLVVWVRGHIDIRWIKCISNATAICSSEAICCSLRLSVRYFLLLRCLRYELTVPVLSPIYSYGGQGVAKKGLKPAEIRCHAVIYMTHETPTLTEDEKRRAQDMLDPFSVTRSSDGHLLSTSRIRFDRVYSIQYNLRVTDVGRICGKEQLERLTACWLEASASWKCHWITIRFLLKTSHLLRGSLLSVNCNIERVISIG